MVFLEKVHQKQTVVAFYPETMTQKTSGAILTIAQVIIIRSQP